MSEDTFVGLRPAHSPQLVLIEQGGTSDDPVRLSLSLGRLGPDDHRDARPHVLVPQCDLEEDVHGGQGFKSCPVPQ